MMAGQMQAALPDLFRHNRWANLELLEICEGLNEEQLDSTVVGTYGTIRQTLRHIVGAEERYVARLSRKEPGPSLEESSPSSRELRERTMASGEALVSIATAGPEDEGISVNFRGKPFLIDPRVILIQAINHATEHRSQIMTILTHQAIEPPVLDGWTYGAANDLMRSG